MVTAGVWNVRERGKRALTLAGPWDTREFPARLIVLSWACGFQCREVSRWQNFPADVWKRQPAIRSWGQHPASRATDQLKGSTNGEILRRVSVGLDVGSAGRPTRLDERTALDGILLLLSMANHVGGRTRSSGSAIRRTVGCEAHTECSRRSRSASTARREGFQQAHGSRVASEAAFFSLGNKRRSPCRPES